MIVVNYILDSGKVKPLGLLAEHATETAFIQAADLQQPGIQAQNTPYLGKVAISSGELVQLVEVDALLTPEVIALLFREEQ